MLGNTTKLPGDTVYINDIGEQPTNRSDPGTILVCVATDVSSSCCRGRDNNNGDPLGDLLGPNRNTVISLSDIGSTSDILYKVRRTRHLRLGSLGTPTGPLGVYTCVLPDMNGVDVTANITISSKLTLIIMYFS